VPDGFSRGKPFHKYDWQFWVAANHYRIREDAKWLPERPLLNQAFTYRRSLVVGPQKSGKGPDAATITAAEAVGPTVFGGWARPARATTASVDGGCPCGWYVRLRVGEPKGIRHPSPLIQLTATSQEQVDNVYRPLVAMIHLGPLKHTLKPRENFIRIVGNSDDPDMDRIDAVTSSALSRLGNPISFALQDETGTYTTSNKMRNVAETQRRGAAGMGGRTMEHTNPWDPAENSVAQATWEAQTDDVFKFYRVPPKKLRFMDKRERRKILEFVYAGSDHVNIDSIEAECFELMQKDPAQAERFFGGRVVQGAGSWLPEGLWEGAVARGLVATS
jgi:hypothetical protein